MPYIISSWSVAEGVRLSVSKSKLVYSVQHSGVFRGGGTGRCPPPFGLNTKIS